MIRNPNVGYSLEFPGVWVRGGRQPLAVGRSLSEILYAHAVRNHEDNSPSRQLPWRSFISAQLVRRCRSEMSGRCPGNFDGDVSGGVEPDR